MLEFIASPGSLVKNKGRKIVLGWCGYSSSWRLMIFRLIIHTFGWDKCEM
jgi:hypothetical protein